MAVDMIFHTLVYINISISFYICIIQSQLSYIKCIKSMKRYLCILFIAITCNNIGAQNFKFALITDIHVTPTTTAFEDLTRSVSQLNNTQGLDFVLATGDLTENGDRQSLIKVKEKLDELNIKYYAISGNHETKWSESAATAFAHIYGSERFKFEHEGILFLGFNTGPIIRMMDGHVAPQDIAWLKKELSAAKPNQPVIIVTHYPLTETDVDNWYEVTDVLRNYNIKVILGGHYHRNVITAYDGIPAVINRSNLRDKDDQIGGYSIYEVTPDSIKVFEQKIGKEPRFWGGYSLKETYFTADNSQYKRPDYSVNQTYSNVKRVWEAKNPNAIYSAPMVYINKVYVGDDLGILSCYSIEDGKKLWEYKTGNRILGTPAAENNIVVVGSADKFIYGLNATNGKLLWKLETQEPVMGAVAIEKGIAYIGGSDTKFRAINIKTGKLAWEYEGIKGYVETRPLLYDNKVIFGAWDNNLYALNQKDGKLAWTWNGGRTRLHFSPAAVWPVATGGKVFFTAPDRIMTAVDVKTGKTVWETKDKEVMVRETIGLSEDKLRLYSKTMQDSVVCYSTEGNEAKRLWTTDAAYGYDHAASMPLEKDGTVFGSTKNGIIFAIEGKTGELLWKHKVGNSLINTIVPIDKNTCIFTSGEGIVGKLSSK